MRRTPPEGLDPCSSKVCLMAQLGAEAFSVTGGEEGFFVGHWCGVVWLAEWKCWIRSEASGR